MNKCVLFIDDQYDIWEDAIRSELHEFGIYLVCEEDPSNALHMIKKTKPDVVLLDVFFDEENLGKPTLEKIKKKHPELPVMIMTATMDKSEIFNPDDYELADFHYYKGPLDSGDYQDLAEKLDWLIKETLANKLGLADDAGLTNYGFIVGKTQAMQKVAKTIEEIAPQNNNVLITGSTGTGKNLVAKSIHFNSPRREMPFVKVNVGVLQKELAESELFGHVKGAFSGAIRDKKGRFEIADRGTLFLDEIGELPLDLQVKLLHVLDEGSFERVGDEKSMSVDVRIIAATNRDLNQMVKQEKFRQDLFFRLNIINIQLPILQERIEDIQFFYPYFIRLANEQSGKNIDPVLRNDVMEILASYPWPGNVRELRNEILKAVALIKKRNVLTAQDFSTLQSISETSSPFATDPTLIVSQIFRGELQYKILKNQFKFEVKSPIMRSVLKKIVERWIHENGKKPEFKNLADLLQMSEGNARAIYVANDYPKNRWPEPPALK